MTNKDKVIAAFLVSLGLFSVANATKYVISLSGSEKESILSVAATSNGNIIVCTGSGDIYRGNDNENQNSNA